MIDPSNRSRGLDNLFLAFPFFLLITHLQPVASATTQAPAYPPFAQGNVVGRIELDAPSAELFVMRATLPVPAGTWTGNEQQTPFQVRDRDGHMTSAQLEIVSRYPVNAHGADVVEVISRVRRPSGVSSGVKVWYDIVYSPTPKVNFLAEPDVQALLQLGVALETRDVFGHLYRADLLRDLRLGTSDLRVLRNGEHAHQVRTHEILVPVNPVGGASGTLPHHVGVHAYVTRWHGEDVVSMDLRIYNGGSGQDTANPLDDPNREVYFDQLALRIPAGWNVLSVYGDPFLGGRQLQGSTWVVPLVKPLPGNKLHVMPAQAQMNRRVVLYRNGHASMARVIAEEQTLGFCRDAVVNGTRLMSWWNPATARYLTQKQPLPQLPTMAAALRVQLDQKFDLLEQQLLAGTATNWPYPVTTPVLGWAHPWGLSIGYAHGGDEIEFFPGADVAVAASRKGYRTFQIALRMYNSRHATTLYDANGDATRLEDWLLPGGPEGLWNPTWVWIKPVTWLGDPFGFNAAPSFQVDAVVSQGRTPPYQAELFDFQHIDDQHLVRYTRPAKVLTWLGNDALAKDDLLMQAELSRLTFSDYPNNPNGDAIAIGMYLLSQYVDQYPGLGAHVHRAAGWEIDAVASAHATTTPANRADLERWCDGIVMLLRKGQDRCNGVLGGNPKPDLFGGQYRVRSSISEAILENALYGMRESVYGDHRPVQARRTGFIIARSARAMISPEVWDSVNNRVHFYTATGPYDETAPSFCGFVPPGGHEGGDNYQGWSTLAYGYRLTGDARFLTKALEMAGGNIMNVPTFGSGYLQNAAPVIALFQELGL